MTASSRFGILTIGLCCLWASNARSEELARHFDFQRDSLGPEILVGRVTTDFGEPIVGAEVIVTRGPDRLVERTTTDSAGNWTVRFDRGTGDYLVYIAHPDRTTFRQRVTRGSTGFPAVGSRDSVFAVTARLSHTVTELATIHIRASSAHPERNFNGPANHAEPGSSGRDVDDFIGQLSPGDAGNIFAQAVTTPGLTPAASGVSAFGLAANQSSVVLGSLQLTTSQLPRDARTFTRVAKSTYDPAKGWFSGAQVSIDLSPGSTYSQRHAHVSIDASQLQYASHDDIEGEQKFSSFRGSYGGEGGLDDDRLAYNFGVDVARRSQPNVSITNTSSNALATAGISNDSLNRILGALSAQQIPLYLNSANTRSTDELSIVGRLGNPYFDYKKFQSTRRILGLTVFGNIRRSSDIGTSLLSTPSRGASLDIGGAGVQGMYSSFVTSKDWLFDARSGLSLSGQSWTPNSTLPGATALIGSSNVGVIPIAFGGNGALESRQRNWLWENLASLSFYIPGHNRHQLALATDVRLDGTSSNSSDRSGSFQYQSFDDVLNNQPSSFYRLLASPRETANEWNGFLSFADDWRATPSLEILYGLRGEGNYFVTTPSYNSALNQALGVRTDRVPNTMALSPRFGFTWRRNADQGAYTLGRFGFLNFPASSVIRGGVGEFRSLLTPDLVANSVAATGLPGTFRQLLCTGPAVPSPDWPQWNSRALSFPDQCADGTAGSGFSDAAPSVTAISQSYTAPRSWRGNLALTGLLPKIAYSVEGFYSLNLNQPGMVDANFAGVEQFTVSGEGRPVYVTPTNIVPSTGALTPLLARRSADFGSVLVRRSDLRSTSRQLVVSLSPSHVHQFWLSGSYVLGSASQQAYGFDGATFGDPRARESSAGDYDIRHQFLLQAGVGRGGITATLFARVQSGIPFTPLVGSDINGDGLANDRAFDFDPSGLSGDTVLRQELRSLATHGSQSVRACLDANIGVVFGRNSCRTPWSASVNARIGIDAAKLGLGRGKVIGLNFTNPLGGLDQLLHGGHLRGWGDQPLPDPALLRVRSFDPAALRFNYEVNPRFGQPRSSAAIFRVPFRVTVDLAFDLAPPLVEQQLDKWLSPGRRGQPGARMSAEDIRKRYSRNTPDPYGSILDQSDSLLLRPLQVEQLKQAQARLAARTDSIWMQLAESLSRIGDDYDVRALVDGAQKRTADAVYEVIRVDVQATLPTILTPVQLRLLPASAEGFYTARKDAKRQYFFL